VTCTRYVDLSGYCGFIRQSN